MTTGTDALVAEVREAFRDAQPIADTARFDAALDALAVELRTMQGTLEIAADQVNETEAELERERRRANTAETELAACRMGRGEFEVELERVRVERDELREAVDEAKSLGFDGIRAQRDKALAALREELRERFNREAAYTPRALERKVDAALTEVVGGND